MNKGIVISGIIGIIIITTVVILVSSVSDIEKGEVEVLTGTPSDNYPEIDRDKFCGAGDAKSTKYIKEYKIPTDCTQPLAIVTSPNGNVWFAQSNTGKLAKFNPLTESFTEYDNRFWPTGDRSMIWGLDYASDGTLWFTDDTHNSIWKFDITTREYERVPFLLPENSLPQRLDVIGSRIIINDFTGNQIIYFDNIYSLDELVTYSLPPPAQNSVSADFTIDLENNLWFTNWIPDQEGSLVKINQTKFDLAIQNNSEVIEFNFFPLPNDLSTPNGISEDNSGNIWIADSSSSLFFKFDPISENFTKYSTSDPPIFSYGNHTGQIKSSISQPYWIEKSPSGIVFNEPSANRIAVFDPTSETLVEYSIPSKNPYWGDCDNEKNCGISQVFDFTIDGDKIWFTEWAENKIGVLDTSILLPIDVQPDTNRISIKPGESKDLYFVISSISQSPIKVSPIFNNPDFENNVNVTYNSNENYLLNSDIPLEISISVSASEIATSGEYKILLGVETDLISFSKFVTVTIEE